MEAPAIGIDLGTTYSCVAVCLDGDVQIIPNEQGNRTTPSYVAFSDAERLIGDPAKGQVAINPTNTIFDAKRLIGRKYDDENLQADMKHWPFKVVNDGGTPKIQVEFKGEEKTFTPEEVSSMVLIKMKETAERYLKTTVEDAVITVPAYFNDSQRQATKDAGTIAGLNVLKILNEPTAAALAYGLNLEGKKNVLIFDLGGGTFDVSILSIEDGSLFEVRSTAGNTHLGGEDFDNRIVDHLVEEFKRKFNKDVTKNRRAMARLRTAGERAKRTLSSTIETSLEIDALFDGLDFYTKLSRVRFEELCIDLFRSTIDVVQKAVDDAKMSKGDIDDIVLVGGSTRIPKVQKLLQDHFNGKELNLNVDPDEAVAYGAAVQAAILLQDTSADILDVVLVDVTPLSLGVQIEQVVMSKIIERNTPIPAKHTKLYTTLYDNQTTVTFPVFEGERPLTKDNNRLGSFTIKGIPPKPRGVPDIKVTFEIDANGILYVTAKETETGITENITITNNKGRLSQVEIDRMLKDAEKFRKEDEEQRKRIAARHELESYVFSLKQALQIDGKKLSEREETAARNECQLAANWLSRNTLAEKEEYEYFLNKLAKSCLPFVKKIRGVGSQDLNELFQSTLRFSKD